MIYSFSNRTKEAALYYLYIKADGIITNDEIKIYNELCEELKLPDKSPMYYIDGNQSKEDIIEKCNVWIEEDKDALNIIQREGIAEMHSGLFSKRYKDLARIIWNLINLGYSDTEFTEEEKRILHYLVDKWSIEQATLQEFIDTADTMLALVNQKKRLLSVVSEEEQKMIETNIDEKIKLLFNDVMVTIEEISL